MSLLLFCFKEQKQTEEKIRQKKHEPKEKKTVVLKVYLKKLVLGVKLERKYFLHWKYYKGEKYLHTDLEKLTSGPVRK